ncbi:hypothetical protein BDW62DRAFT_192690, partial [Aspergillus aurantiobrunneus]
MPTRMPRLAHCRLIIDFGSSQVQLVQRRTLSRRRFNVWHAAWQSSDQPSLESNVCWVLPSAASALENV